MKNIKKIVFFVTLFFLISLSNVSFANTNTWTIIDSSNTNTGSVIDENENELNNKRWEIQSKYSQKFNDLKKKYNDKKAERWQIKEYVKEKNELFKEYKKEILETRSGSTINMKEVQLKIKDKRKEIIERMQEKRKEIREKYKNIYKVKYWKMISSMNEEKIEILLWKIDDLIDTVNEKDYEDETKARLIGMLESLRQMVVDRLEQINIDDELNIDWLFEE